VKVAACALLERCAGLAALQGALQSFTRNNAAAGPGDFRHALVGVKAPPASWPIPAYAVQQDSALLAAVGRCGYGHWQQIRAELAATAHARWERLQAPQIARRVDYLLGELARKRGGGERPTGGLDELRVIEKFRRRFRPLRASLVALESLKTDTSPTSSQLGSLLTDHLVLLGDFIAGEASLRGDREAWDFIGCFWPFEKGSTGAELERLYQACKSSR
jgi:hypothetical protein